MVKTILIILAIVFFIIMSSIMLILERDKPRNMIIWLIIFLFTSIIGGLIYLMFRLIIYKKKQTLQTKQWEDDIFANLIDNQIFKNDVDLNDDLFTFNKMAYNASTTTNNSYDLMESYNKFKESLIKDIQSANNYIIFEVTKVNAKDFENIKAALIKKASEGVIIKFVYDRLNNFKLIKEMKNAGIRVVRFSKFYAVGKIYSNIRNCICIDGEIAYISNLDVRQGEINGKNDVLHTHLKFKGDVVQSIDVAMHQDVIFATNKFLEYTAPKQENFANASVIQYATNHLNNNMELLLIKAISKAVKSINLQLEEFIPTESIMALLKFAINSNINVNLMVPLKTNKHSKYFASRAYAKELALIGANVYLYDGFIRFNAITIDDKYVLCGSYTLDREHITNSLQNVVIIQDGKAVNYFNKLFDFGIENSYKIANAKYMLMREKFFKNFV